MREFYETDEYREESHLDRDAVAKVVAYFIFIFF